MEQINTNAAKTNVMHALFRLTSYIIEIVKITPSKYDITPWYVGQVACATQQNSKTSTHISAVARYQRCFICMSQKNHSANLSPPQLRKQLTKQAFLHQNNLRCNSQSSSYR